MDVNPWPQTKAELDARQRELAARAAGLDPWRPDRDAPLAVGGVFFASVTLAPVGPREPAWAGAAVVRGGRVIATAAASGGADSLYRPGYLALREGPLLERVIRALDTRPDVLLVNASGRDHPRRAGLALHLGAMLGLPTVGVTDRPLLAGGPEPDEAWGSAAPLVLEGEVVGFHLRTRQGTRAVTVHAAWRTDPETAREVVLAATGEARTPEPLRVARYLARVQRALDEGRTPPGWKPGTTPISPRYG